MKQTVTESMFVDAFRACGREGNFSLPARRELFAYFEELERETGKEVELDPVAVCCEWAEYATAVEAAAEYDWTWDGVEIRDLEDGEASGERRQADALEWLRDRTTVLEVEDGGVVIQQF